MSEYKKLTEILLKNPKTWLVTGVAGFIGSNLLEELLKLGQRVVGIDNFETGKKYNLDEVRSNLSISQWSNFKFIEGDILRLEDCENACVGVDYVLHQAALGSVPRSLVDPIASNHANVTGFLNILVAARDAKVKSFTYASSSSAYGDDAALPKLEDRIGRPLSIYAVTKYINELYAQVFALNYGFKSIGLRYFNVYGPRQDPNGPYAAVIPRWISLILNGDKVCINGDGNTSRDFCFIANVVQANLLAACAPDDVKNNVFNIAVGEQTSLNKLYKIILENSGVDDYNLNPEYCEYRAGDVRHSLADVSKAYELLGYRPTHHINQGILKTLTWYINSSCAQHKK